MKRNVILFATYFLLLCIAVSIANLVFSYSEEQELQLPGDAQDGWQIFFTKNCVKCHSVWGEGGTIGPDLGRSSSVLTAGQLAGEMWNHIPRMRQKMEEEGIQFTDLNYEEMADIFAFLYFIRYLGEPGNPDKGKTLLESKGCVKCHSILNEEGKVGPALGKWGKYINPIVWTQVMWNHALKMKEKLKDIGMDWPEFNAQEMADLIAYIRGVSSSEEKVYLTPGSPTKGKNIFEEKNCIKCHAIRGKGNNIGPDLASPKSPKNFIELTSTMWNHLPKMLKTMEDLGIKVSPPTPQEMADIISFLFAIQYMDEPGNAEIGKKIFYEKNCIKCHTKDGSGGTVGPDLSKLKGKARPIQIAYLRWKAMHGSTMLEEMTRLGIPWPYFKGNEMVDLMEFLNK